MTHIEPHDHEDESEFAERAHHALASSIPDADERTKAVFDSWRDARGESEEEKAAHSKFPDDQYAHIENVPVFMEHEYPRYLLERDGRPKLDADGRQLKVVEKYDLDALKSICANLNYRIRNTKDFSPISDKHSPKKGSEESKPRLFGFSGPYGLGQVGNEDTKWAIIAKKEHWFKDKAHLAREYPRRSPEVYLGRPMEDRILDPITALGADTPALDMGIHYSQDESSGELVACYSGPPITAHYEAPCFAGGGNTFVPEPLSVKKKSYAEAPQAAAPAAPAPTTNPGSSSVLISPEDANTIIQALMETEVMQWATAQMMADKAPKTDDPAGAEKPGAVPPLDPTAAAEVPPPEEPAVPGAAGAPPFPPKKAQLSEETAPDVKDKKKPFGEKDATGDAAGPESLRGDGDDDKPNSSKENIMPDAISPEAKKDEKDKKPETAKYTEREETREETARYAALEAQVEELKAINAETNRKATVSERNSTIRAYRLEGFDIDEPAEIERCSLENMPTEGEFKRHMETIVKYAGKIPVNVTLHTPDAPLHEDRQRAEARKAARAGATAKGSDPAFVTDPDFLEEVATAAYDLQSSSTYDSHQGSVYHKARQQVIDRRLARTNGAGTKVG